jgi:hypothetical protein
VAGPLIFILILGVIGLAAYFAWQAKQKRREGLRLFALQQGMQFSTADPFGIPASYPFHLFGLGDGRGCENVMAGEWKGLPVKEADYWYYTESTDSKGHQTKTYHRHSVVVAALTCVLPHVSVGRENLFSRLTDHLGFHDIEFESEAFNRAYDVKADDREFAFKLLDARMIRWLESLDGGFGFEVSGPNMLVWSGRRGATELIPLFGSARMFCDHIPRLVWNEYGGDPARPDIPAAGPEERSTT